MKFRSKGLQRLYEHGDASRVAANHLPRLQLILTALEHSTAPTDMRQPGFHLHRQRGSELWSVRVSAYWRVTFKFVEGEAVEVDLLDYR